MAKFKYRMQSILNLRCKLEEQQRATLASARFKLNEEEGKLDELFRRKRDYEENIREAFKEKFNVHEVRMRGQAYASMDYFITEQKTEVKKAEVTVEKEQDKMIEAMRRRKIQEKLREKFHERFLKEENYKEAIAVDELVSYKYGVKEKGGRI